MKNWVLPGDRHHSPRVPFLDSAQLGQAAQTTDYGIARLATAAEVVDNFLSVIGPYGDLRIGAPFSAPALLFTQNG